MPLFVAPSHERWRAKCSPGYWNTGEANDTTPPVEPTPGDASAVLVHAYYERWSGRLVQQQGVATDVPAAVVTADAPPPQLRHPFLFKAYARQPQLGWTEASEDSASEPPDIPWRATRQWAVWRPQAQLGRQAPTDAAAIVTLDTPSSPIRHPFLFKGYARQPQLGWAEPSEDSTSAIPDASWRVTRQWTPWRPQPQLGWQAAPNEQDANLKTPGPSWQAVRQWTPWQRQPQLGLGGSPQTFVQPPAGEPTPPIYHPYLFKSYLRQPWLGTQQAPNEQDTKLETPGPSWSAVRQWATWRPQPQLGWQQAPNDQDANLEIPGPSWQTTRQWAKWGRQPWLGLTSPTDTAVTPIVETPLSVPARAIRFLEYKRQPSLGQAAPSQQDTSLTTPLASWAAVRQWARWRPQPTLGQTPATDAAHVDQPVTFQPVRQWSSWRPQPTLGWQQVAGDQDTSAQTPPVAWATTRQWSRWNPQPRLGWAPATDTVQEVLEGGPTISLRPYRFRDYARQPQLGWATPANFEAPAVFKEPFMVVPPRPYLFKPYKLQPWLGWANYGFESSVAFAVEFPVGVGRPVRRISGRGLATATPAYAEAFGRVRLHGEGLAVAVAAYTETLGRLRYHATGSVGVEPARSRASGVVAEPGQWIIVVDGDDDFTIIAG